MNHKWIFDFLKLGYWGYLALENSQCLSSLEEDWALRLLSRFIFKLLHKFVNIEYIFQIFLYQVQVKGRLQQETSLIGAKDCNLVVIIP